MAVRIDLVQDLHPIAQQLGEFYDENPQVSDRLKRAHVIALAEWAQKFPSRVPHYRELCEAMKTAGFLLVCEEVAPGVLSELVTHYETTLKEIFPRISFREWKEGDAKDQD